MLIVLHHYGNVNEMSAVIETHTFYSVTLLSISLVAIMIIPQGK